jgi:hypothetical protein
MTRFTSLDARVERLEFGKSQQGDPFFKVIKLLGGRLREYWFPLRDYELAREEIVAALSVGEEPWPQYGWDDIEYLVETVGPILSMPTRPGLHGACFVLPNGQVITGLITDLPAFLPSLDGSRFGLHR